MTTSEASETVGVEYLNPEGMVNNPAYTQAVAVRGPATTLYIGLQHAQDAEGKIVGDGDLAAQTTQILANIDRCLQAAGAERRQIIQMTVILAEGQDLRTGFGAFQSWWGKTPNPPTNNVFFVSSFAIPGVVVGVQAIAVIPDEG